MSDETHPVHMDLTSEEQAELMEFYQSKINFHQGYVNRAKFNVYENDGKRDMVIKKHEKKIEQYENLLYEIKIQCW